MQFDAYAARSLAARVGEDAPLGAYPWIHWDERLNAGWLDVWLARARARRAVVLRVDVSAAAMHELIAAGVGVQFLACVEGDADPSLVRVGPMSTPSRAATCGSSRSPSFARRRRACGPSPTTWPMGECSR
jgi:hypothetical protein